jgi:hypothetical protein
MVFIGLWFAWNNKQIYWNLIDYINGKPDPCNRSQASIQVPLYKRPQCHIRRGLVFVDNRLIKAML